MTACMMTYPHAPSTHCALPITHDGPHVTRDGRGWYDPDDMDGGVTAALIEKEAESCPEDCEYRIAHGRLVKTYRETLRRAEKAEQERDEARANAYNWEATAEEWEKRALAAESRPLTPDAITPAMIGRAYDALVAEPGWAIGTRVEALDVLRHLLTAALTEPPARPEGAEEIEAVLRDEWTFSDEDGGEEAFADLAQRLASRGVRVVSEDGAA